METIISKLSDAIKLFLSIPCCMYAYYWFDHHVNFVKLILYVWRGYIQRKTSLRTDFFGSRYFMSICTTRKYLLFTVVMETFYNIYSVKYNSVGQWVTHIPGWTFSLTEVGGEKVWAKSIYLHTQLPLIIFN